MIIEKNVLNDLVYQFVNSKCDISSPINESLKFKTYLKKDENNCFCIIDKEHSIKCLFNKDFLKHYFSTYPSSTTLEHYDGMLIMIKKATFDVLFYKNINKTVSYRVVLCISEFELDNAQKISNETYNAKYPNVNLVQRIEEKLSSFYYDYITKSLKENEGNIEHHLKVDANIFLKRCFNKERDYSSIRKVLPKGSSFSFLYNDKDSFAFLDDHTSLLLKEIQVKDNQIIKESNEDYDDNINVENLKRLDFKSMFYKQPSQENKTIKDFTLYEKINLPVVNHDNSNKSFFGKKRERDGDENADQGVNELPISIQNLINRMNNKPAITISLFEKYKNYKKFNADEYIRDNL